MNERSKRGIQAGTMFEYRVARLRFVQGSFARRSIGLWSPSAADRRQLAELDCLIVDFDPQLRKSIEVIECKTGSGSTREIDRLLWIVGVRALVGASSVSLAKAEVSRPARELARKLGVSVLDQQSISEAEQDIGIPDDWWPGFHSPQFGEGVVKRARQNLNSSQDLQRAGRFLFGSYWFVDDFSRVKQLRRLFRLIVQNESRVPGGAFGLGLAEATVLFAMTAFSVGSWRGQLNEDEFRTLVAEELSTGLGDPQGLRRLLRRVDDLYRDQIEGIHQAYQAVAGQRIPMAIPSFETQVLTPPEWTDAFADLSLRLWRRSHVATDLLRWMDLRLARIAGLEEEINAPFPLFRNSEQELLLVASLIFTFLRRFWDVPEHVYSDILDLPSKNGGVDAESSNESSEKEGHAEASSNNPAANQQILSKEFDKAKHRDQRR